MSAWSIRKPEATHIRGFCVSCARNLQKKRSDERYRALCSSCDKRRFKGKNYKYCPYSKYKLNQCERCAFIAEDTCQLDIHHIDQDHHNNDPNNLKTLCANCHRLEHKEKRRPEDFSSGL